MSKYSTISVPEDIKKVLEEVKGKREWGEFLLNLYVEARRLRGNRAFEELVKILKEDDLNSMIKSSREFRERFTLR